MGNFIPLILDHFNIYGLFIGKISILKEFFFPRRFYLFIYFA